EDFANIMKGPGSFDFSAQVSGAGVNMAMKGSIAIEGKNVAVTMDLGGMKMKVLSKDGASYMITDAQKMMMKMPAGQDATQGLQTDFSDLKKTGEGKGEVNGKTLPYEEYEMQGKKAKFYVSDGKVYAIESAEQGAKSLMIIENLKAGVPKGTFDFPAGYQKVGF
ncbi:MAG: hypothetical protein LBQ96_02875, partial [Fusobacteriaceae bacterium]|nr:hypothetical protein [Fusobacteriaceae bacterium]